MRDAWMSAGASYLYNLTSLKILVSKKRPLNNAPEMKTNTGRQYIKVEQWVCAYYGT